MVKTYGGDVAIGDVIVSNMGVAEYVGTVDSVPVEENGYVTFQMNDPAGITRTKRIKDTTPVCIEIARRTR